MHTSAFRSHILLGQEQAKLLIWGRKSKLGLGLPKPELSKSTCQPQAAL